MVDTLEDIVNGLNGFKSYFKNKSLGDKNRLSIPSKYHNFFEKEGSNQVIVASLKDESDLPYILMSTFSFYSKFIFSNGIPLEFGASNCDELVIDKQNRVLLSPEFRNDIRVGEDNLVTLIGRGYHFRVYSNENGEIALKNMKEYFSMMVNKKVANMNFLRYTQRNNSK